MPDFQQLKNSPALTGTALAGDAAMARVGWERWRDLPGQQATLSSHESADPTVRLLDAIFGSSSFLTQCVLAEPGLVYGWKEMGADKTAAALVQRLEALVESPLSVAETSQEIRKIRRQVALLTAMADISHVWPLATVTGMLSALADLAAEAALRALWQEAVARGQLSTADDFPSMEGSGYVLLGMGKLGAGELNYSSDIDLIALYDPDRVPIANQDKLRQRMIRLTQGLVECLQTRTEHGYVFRTDLRLRPDPGSTPLAISLPAAEHYYESAGQNWERAAFIKARPIAGSRATGQAFLDLLRPFIWRKNLDFASIQDIHSIKRQINAQRGGDTIDVPGHNVKLGRGGIREIEFFAQTQQLIFGGRQPELRIAGTLDALDALVATNHIAAETRDDLSTAYVFLRTVEHRIQMLNDQQTHIIPADEAALNGLARFLGYPDAEPFSADVRLCLDRVSQHYGELFEEAPNLGHRGNLVFTGDEDDPETLETIARLGFQRPDSVAAMIRNWHRGRYRATRTPRARQLLTELTPALLEKIGSTADPDGAFVRLDQFLGGLPAGIQIFSLLHANPALFALLADIMGGAPRLARTLGRAPHLLDAILLGEDIDEGIAQGDLRDALATEMGAAGAYEQILDCARRWVQDHEFRVGVAQLRRQLTPAAAGLTRSRVAETTIQTLLPHIQAQFSTRHGHIDGARFCIFALGKLGGQSLSAASDLDLVFIYDVAEDAAASDGEKPLPPSHYFSRYAQRVFDALSAPTSEGPLFDIDMRLRPSGNTGPLASSRQAFVDYQQQQAWTWEHMALTRARFIAGDKDLGDAINTTITGILTQAREPQALKQDIAAMRVRIMAEHPGRDLWDIKYARGGLIDIEFLAQYLQLNHAATHPDILATDSGRAFQNMATAGILTKTEALTLCTAERLWLDLQATLRLIIEGDLTMERLVPSVQTTLAKAVDAANFTALEEQILETRKKVSALFASYIGEPAATNI